MVFMTMFLAPSRAKRLALLEKNEEPPKSSYWSCNLSSYSVRLNNLSCVLDSVFFPVIPNISKEVKLFR